MDNRKEGRDLALSFPENLRANLVVDFNDREAISKIKSWAGDGGVSSVVVCTDDIPANGWALKILRPRGTMVVVGLPSPELNGPLRFNAFDLVFGELTVKGSLVANKELLDEMLAVVAQHGIRSHITTIASEQTPQLPEMYMDEHLKGRLVMKM